jgi:hypothetical protein
VSGEPDAGYWLITAVIWLLTAIVVLICCWWVHGNGSRRRLTREVGGWLAIVGLVRCWWDLAQGLGLLTFGVVLWHMADRFRQRHLDDLPVMGRSAAGGDDADDDNDEE